MGVAHRDLIARRLVAGGLPPDTPVAAITWGTRPEQRSVRTTLAHLGVTPLQPPATIVIGAVAGLDLAWYQRRPLFGRTVVVTRARAQASDLIARLAALGARTLEVPTIAIADPADGGAALARAARAMAGGRYAWTVLTSANAARRLADLLPDARAWAGTRIAAIGSGTAAALAEYRLLADLVPERSVAEGLLDVFPSASTARAAPPTPTAVAPRYVAPTAGQGRTVLLARAAVARDVLPDGLAAKGWEVDVVDAYRTQPVAPSPDVADAAARADAICFTSSSTVTNYLAVAGVERVPPIVACIGPVTADTARAAGVSVTVTRLHPHRAGPGRWPAFRCSVGPPEHHSL